MIEHYQPIISDWQTERFGEGAHLNDRLTQFFQEIEETHQEVVLCEDEVFEIRSPEDLAREITDTIISGLGVIEALGYNFEDMFYQKLHIMNAKYPPNKIREYILKGFSSREASQLCKKEWMTK